MLLLNVDDEIKKASVGEKYKVTYIIQTPGMKLVKQQKIHIENFYHKFAQKQLIFFLMNFVDSLNFVNL